MDFKDMHPEQKTAVNWILNNKIGCLSPECGSGKTVIGLTAFAGFRKLNRGRLSRLLVVSTPSGIRETWAKENLKWGHLRTLTMVILDGERKWRETLAAQAFEDDVEIWCISYNNLEWFLNWQLSILKNQMLFDMVFADEGSCLKGPTSKWRKTLTKLSEGSQYRIISTATPAPHDAMDYWGLCKYLDNGTCLGANTITEFRGKYCIAIPIPNKVAVMYKLRQGADEEIKRSVKHLFYTFNIVKEVPIEEINVWEDLTEESLKIYRKVEAEQCINSIVQSQDGRETVNASLDALSLSNKLAQITNGFVYANQKQTLSGDSIAALTSQELNALTSKTMCRKVHLFGDRIERFKELIGRIKRSHGNVPIAIPYLYQYDLEMLEKAFPSGERDSSPGVVERWNKREVPYLFLQYARSSKALNLQEGGNILAVYSPTWNWEHDYQIVRRLARQGQKAEKVFLYRLWFRDTIDEEKYEILKKRETNHRTFQHLIIKRAMRYKP